MAAADGSRQRKVLLTVEYDGTEYGGWQFQPGPGPKTIQGALHEAIREALGQATEVEGASRTDRGVHAWGQAASFVTGTPVPTHRLPQVVNGCLPPDIRVREARDVDLGFHVRYDAYGKIYRYLFLQRRLESAFLTRFTTRLEQRPDLELMRGAAADLVGELDFRSFQNTSKAAPETTVREVFGVRVVDADPVICVEVSGAGFLYKMVRTMVGTLLEVGLGRRPVASIAAVLAARDRRLAGPTLEARGLSLVGVYYTRDDLEEDRRSAEFWRPLWA